MTVWTGGRCETLKLMQISLDYLVSLNLSSGINQLFDFECLHSELLVLLFEQFILLLDLHVVLLDTFIEHFLLHPQ